MRIKLIGTLLMSSMIINNKIRTWKRALAMDVNHWGRCGCRDCCAHTCFISFVEREREWVCVSGSGREYLCNGWNSFGGVRSSWESTIYKLKWVCIGRRWWNCLLRWFEGEWRLLGLVLLMLRVLTGVREVESAFSRVRVGQNWTNVWGFASSQKSGHLFRHLLCLIWQRTSQSLRQAHQLQ